MADKSNVLEHTAQQIDEAVSRALSGGDIDITLANKADLGEDGKVPAVQVDAYSKSESISAETRTALGLSETSTPDDALAEIARQLSESKGIQIVKLWENASLSSEFTAQTLSIDTTGFDGILVSVIGRNTNINASTSADILNMVIGTTRQILNQSASKLRFRDCSWTSETEIAFGDAMEVTNYGDKSTRIVINGYSIPKTIYGIKL